MKNYKNEAADKRYFHILENLSDFPFSFDYDGKTYKGFNENYFRLEKRDTDKTADKETDKLYFLFENTLTVTLVLTHYFTHGVTEFTVLFKNSTLFNSGVIKAPSIDLEFKGNNPVLKGILGDHVNKYRPYAIDIQDKVIDFSSDGGRATHINFPYFNIEYGNGGAMLAIGWAGTWSARFSGNKKSATYKASAVNGLKTYLKPDEEIRTALFVVAPYTLRNENYATNFWRDWFIKYNLPCFNADGEKLHPFSTCCFASDTGLPNSDGSISENHKTWKPTLDKMLSEGIKPDIRWLDAGWYIRPDGTSAKPFVKSHDWWDSVGTWTLDSEKWPDDSFKQSVEAMHEIDMKTLVWFEPERVTDPENLAKNFGYDLEWAIKIDNDKAIANNIGNEKCRKWTTDKITSMLKANKVDVYREDNNYNASKLWNYLDALDGIDRKGITESKFIDGHYKMWDDIIACTLSYGGCGFVDSCASGGGRNDLESLRRSVPLLRSDSDRTSAALRLSMTASFNKWIPFCGANTKEKIGELDATGVSDPYVWRASYLPALNIDSQFAHAENEDFDMLRFGLNEWKKVSPFLLKDFYLLTPWHTENDKSGFTAFCYYDSQAEKGVLLAFRQENCAANTLTVKLPFAEKSDRYSLTDEDTAQTESINACVNIYFDTPRQAKLFWINKL